jgi:hypothetical protein
MFRIKAMWILQNDPSSHRGESPGAWLTPQTRNCMKKVVELGFMVTHGGSKWVELVIHVLDRCICACALMFFCCGKCGGFQMFNFAAASGIMSFSSQCTSV